VSLKATGNENSEYFKIFSCMSERNGNVKTLGTTTFQSVVCGGEGGCGTNSPTEVVEIATLYEFDENDRFLDFL
jgi:hypothetical protein